MSRSNIDNERQVSCVCVGIGVDVGVGLMLMLMLMVSCSLKEVWLGETSNTPLCPHMYVSYTFLTVRFCSIHKEGMLVGGWDILPWKISHDRAVEGLVTKYTYLPPM